MMLRVAGIPAVIDLPPGEPGTDATAEAMRAIIDDAQRSRAVQAIAKLVGRSPSALWSFLRERVAFQADPRGSELLRLPDDMLREIETRGLAVGDCDDRTMLGAAIAKAAGWPVAIVVMTPLPNDPVFRHVLFAIRAQQGWMSMDAQEGFQPGTWPAPERIKVYTV